MPRRINQIVNRLLLMGAVEQRDHIDAAMLQAVLADLAADGAFGKPQVSVTPAPAADVQKIELPVAPAPVAPAFDESVWRAALAERDEQIAELQQAIIELADMRAAPVAPVPDFDLAAQLEEANRRIAALEARPGDEGVLAALAEAQRTIAALESRTSEQEQAIRHTLTMLIEWIEAEDFHRAAA